MKKLVLLFIICLLAGTAAVRAAYQRTQTKPGFFIPSGAISNTTNRQMPNSVIQKQVERRFGPSETIDYQPRPTTSTAEKTTAKQAVKPTTAVVSTTPETTEKQDVKPTTTVVSTTPETEPKNIATKNSPDEVEEDNSLTTAAEPAALPAVLEKVESVLNEILPTPTDLPEKNVTQEKTVTKKVAMPVQPQKKPQLTTPKAAAQPKPKPQSQPKPQPQPQPKQTLVAEKRTAISDKAFDISLAEYQKDLQLIADGGTVNNSRLNAMLNEFQNKEHYIVVKAKN